jgi:hypothetical protein
MVTVVGFVSAGGRYAFAAGVGGVNVIVVPTAICLSVFVALGSYIAIAERSVCTFEAAASPIDCGSTLRVDPNERPSTVITPIQMIIRMTVVTMTLMILWPRSRLRGEEAFGIDTLGYLSRFDNRRAAESELIKTAIFVVPQVYKRIGGGRKRIMVGLLRDLPMG